MRRISASSGRAKHKAGVAAELKQCQIQQQITDTVNRIRV
jgi:hypothetical protein